MLDVADVLGQATGFIRTLAPSVVRSSRAQVQLRLDAGAPLHNHLGGPHAAVIFGLGETAAFGILLEVFGDVVSAGAVPLIKDATISYTAVATGVLLASAVLIGDEQSARRSLQDRARASFVVQVVFHRELDAVETARADYTMALLGPAGLRL